ncbi:hypothetical protein V5O48_005203 [Marasmius crinis-equi]|uniref:F-box domain-containing protein n=1 Tax=Marasmius crinis-equi TaxID=585013 RepID=A0ABR3FMZ5_9AGAR
MSMKLELGRLRGRLLPGSSAPAVSTVQLPQDLLHYIFAELDDESVCQCALAARSFLLPAQSRLFRKVVLKEADMSGRSLRLAFRSQPTKAQRLAASLASSPELGKLVKELICEGLPRANRSRRRAWYCEVKVPFCAILPHLSNLRSLSLLFHQDYPIFCASIPSPSRVAILHALHSPELRKLTIENVIESVVYDATHDLLLLRHAVAGGGLEELSVTTFDVRGGLKWFEPWWDIPSIPLCTKAPPNVLRTLRVNGPPTVVERVLKWVTSNRSLLTLTSLSRFEVVGATTPTQLSLVARICQSSPHIRHLGITSGEEPFLSFPPAFSYSTPDSHPLTHTIRWSSSLTANLQTIIFYAITFYGFSARNPPVPSPTQCLSWWCTLLQSTSLPNLREFRIDGRGRNVYYLLSPRNVAIEIVPAEQWQELERALVEGAPKARLRVDLEAQELGDGLERWKEEYFPDEEREGEGESGCGYAYLRRCFPIAHQGGIEFVFNLRIRAWLLLPRRWLARRLLRRIPACEPACYLYTPRERWVRVDEVDEPVDAGDVNAIRSDFQYYIDG